MKSLLLLVVALALSASVAQAAEYPSYSVDAIATYRIVNGGTEHIKWHRGVKYDETVPNELAVGLAGTFKLVEWSDLRVEVLKGFVSEVTEVRISAVVPLWPRAASN